MKKIITLLTVALLATAGVIIYMQFFSPKARALAATDNYMRALLSGDTRASQALHTIPNPAAVSQRSYKITNTTKEKEVLYIRYTFTDGASPTDIRFALNPSSTITTISTGDSLGNTPAGDTKTDTKKQSSSDHCLTKSDLSYIDSTNIYAEKIRGATMIFQPESDAFKTEVGGNLLIDRMADFYKKANQKDFVFELRGYRQTGDLSEQEKEVHGDLFQRRAVALQNGLTQRGVPADRIIINREYNYYDANATNLQNELYVDINIVNRCN